MKHSLDELTIKCTQGHSIVIQSPTEQKNVTQECIKAVWGWLLNDPSQTAIVTTPQGEMYAVTFKMEKLLNKCQK